MKSSRANFGRFRGLWEIETPFLVHMKSHALGSGAEGIIRKNFVRLTCWSWRVSQRQKATGVHYRDTDTDSSDYGPLILPWAMVLESAIVESFL